MAVNVRIFNRNASFKNADLF
ncbi:protein of unknown function [Burkholderia multivorans]